jgi:hypothetical protein
MILPEPVFGRLSPTRISFGLAIGPISLPTPIAQFCRDPGCFVTSGACALSVLGTLKGWHRVNEHKHPEDHEMKPGEGFG